MTDPLLFAAELEQDYCTCLPAYLDRGRTDPQCVSCNMEYERKEAAKVIRSLHSDKQALQAKLDALMLEHCPQDMSVEQIVNWSNHQRKEKA
jgi:hypothetical protein